MTPITNDQPKQTETRSHLLAIGLEDYFQVDTFDSMVAKSHWYGELIAHALKRWFPPRWLGAVTEANAAAHA